MKIIKVNNITLVEKDIIEITDLKSFNLIREELFGGAYVFNCKGIYYLIGNEVAYIYKKNE